MSPLAFACLLALALGAPLTAGQEQGQAPVQDLPPFSRVQVCTPFNVLVSPPPSGEASVQYGIQVDAEAAVSQAIRATVADDALLLETGPFATSQPIKASAQALQTVAD